MQQPTLEAVQAIFFDAMAAGWVAEKPKKGCIADLPGSNTITFTSGDFRVVDFYLVTPHSSKSAGMTTIFYRDQPVWVMYYGGDYEDEVIPFLKKCLHQAYVVERRFYGGRGPVSMRNGNLRYVNTITHGGFRHFAGYESILDAADGDRGYHWYRGMSLLKD